MFAATCKPLEQLSAEDSLSSTASVGQHCSWFRASKQVALGLLNLYQRRSSGEIEIVLGHVVDYGKKTVEAHISPSLIPRNKDHYHRSVDTPV